MQGRKASLARGVRLRQPLAELASFFHRRDATGARERQCNECIRRTVRNERCLQGGLFSQIKSQEEIEFHFVAANFFPI